MNQYPTLHVLGPNPGTYGDMAGKKVLPDLTVDRVARTNQEVVERTVSNGGVGIVPIANRYGGHVSQAIDSLLNHQDTIVNMGSTSIQIPHTLATRAEWQAQGPRRIFSHLQALTQCQHVLSARYPGAQRIETESTTAGLTLAQEPGDYVICGPQAIGSGFVMTDTDIAPQDNRTTFLVFATRNAVTRTLSTDLEPIDVGALRLTDSPGQIFVGTGKIWLAGGNIMELYPKKKNGGHAYHFPFVSTPLGKRRQNLLNRLPGTKVETLARK